MKFIQEELERKFTELSQQDKVSSFLLYKLDILKL